MEIRPIISALMRSKVALILIGLQIALTLAIVCNALFIISQRIETMNRPSGMNEADTFLVHSNGFGANFNTKNATAGGSGADAPPAGRGRRDSDQHGADERRRLERGDQHGAEAEDRDRGPPRSTSSTSTALNSYRLAARSPAATSSRKKSCADGLGRRAPPVIIITKALAEKLFPDRMRVGKQMYLDHGQDQRRPSSA